MWFRTLDRYLAREIALNWFAVSVVLMLILVTTGFAQVLARTAEGELPADLVGWLLLVNSVEFLTWVLPLGIFVGVLLALGRLYRDSEITVMVGSGLSPASAIRPILWVAVPVAFLALFVSGWLLPQAEVKRGEIEADAESRSEIQAVAPGRFVQSGDGRVALYAEEVDGERLLRPFVYQRNDGTDAVEVARTAHQEVDPETGERFLVFEDGRRFEGTPGEERFREYEFETHRVSIPEVRPGAPDVGVTSKPTIELLGSTKPADVAELHWRISQPVIILILAVLALPLSHSGPRKGRAGKITVGILLYITYVNLLAVGRSWVEHGEAPVWLGIWGFHAALLALTVVTMLVRQGVIGMPRLPRRRAA